MAKILIIDDDAAICKMLGGMIDAMGHTAISRQRLQDGVGACKVESPDVVFLDVNMPDGNGLEALPQIRQGPSRPEVIIITGQGDPDGAETAITNGAWDYIQKPIVPSKIQLPLTRVLQYRQEAAQRKRIPAVLNREGIIGDSPALKACLELLAQAAAGDASVLITGKTGTGKELFARAVHANSARADANFVVVDCTVLPERLVESTLFGHVRGAFTGADKAQKGLIAQANKGTLFLDEIGELPMALQKAFLRVLQEHRYRQLGGVGETASDFRLVAATNRDLSQMAADGRFRQDLLYRVRGLVINLPPLRERREDIKTITIHHISRFCERNRIGIKGIAPEVIETLVNHPWPGNIRELVNVLESALSAAYLEQTLSPIHLPTPIRVQHVRRQVVPAGTIGSPDVAVAPAKDFPGFRETMQAHEQAYIRGLMVAAKGEVAAACRLSGLSRSRLYDLVKKHGGR